MDVIDQFVAKKRAIFDQHFPSSIAQHVEFVTMQQYQVLCSVTYMSQDIYVGLCGRGHPLWRHIDRSNEKIYMGEVEIATSALLSVFPRRDVMLRYTGVLRME